MKVFSRNMWNNETYLFVDTYLSVGGDTSGSSVFSSVQDGGFWSPRNYKSV